MADRVLAAHFNPLPPSHYLLPSSSHFASCLGGSFVSVRMVLYQVQRAGQAAVPSHIYYT